LNGFGKLYDFILFYFTFSVSRKVCVVPFLLFILKNVERDLDFRYKKTGINNDLERKDLKNIK